MDGEFRKLVDREMASIEELEKLEQEEVVAESSRAANASTVAGSSLPPSVEVAASFSLGSPLPVDFDWAAWESSPAFLDPALMGVSGDTGSPSSGPPVSSGA